LQEKLPRIEKVFDAIHHSADVNARSPSRSTLAETSYNFDDQTPANNPLFETRLCQLYQNLYGAHQENRIFTTDYNQPLPVPTYLDSKEVSETQAHFESDTVVRQSSEITVQYEVS